MSKSSRANLVSGSDVSADDYEGCEYDADARMADFVCSSCGSKHWGSLDAEGFEMESEDGLRVGVYGTCSDCVGYQAVRFERVKVAGSVVGVDVQGLTLREDFEWESLRSRVLESAHSDLSSVKAECGDWLSLSFVPEVGHWVVTNDSAEDSEESTYLVTESGSCSCKGYQFRSSCKHSDAVSEVSGDSA